VSVERPWFSLKSGFVVGCWLVGRRRRRPSSSAMSSSAMSSPPPPSSSSFSNVVVVVVVSNVVVVAVVVAVVSNVVVVSSNVVVAVVSNASSLAIASSSSAMCRRQNKVSVVLSQSSCVLVRLWYFEEPRCGVLVCRHRWSLRVSSSLVSQRGRHRWQCQCRGCRRDWPSYLGVVVVECCWRRRQQCTLADFTCRVGRSDR